MPFLSFSKSSLAGAFYGHGFNVVYGIWPWPLLMCRGPAPSLHLFALLSITKKKKIVAIRILPCYVEKPRWMWKREIFDWDGIYQYAK